MRTEKVKVSELTPASSLLGLYTLGVDGGNNSVKIPLTWLREASDNLEGIKEEVERATTAANNAAVAAKTATDRMTGLQVEIGKDREGWKADHSSWRAEELARQEAELGRAEAESGRERSETARAGNETVRIENERLRWEKEKDREASEEIRQRREDDRERDTTAALLNAATAIGRLDALSDHRDEIRDGYWWRWDEETGEWYDTGEKARGDVMYATFDVDPATGELSMYTDPGYAGANFEVDENGFLSVII